MSAGKRRARATSLQERRRKKSPPLASSSADNTELLRTLQEIFNELNQAEIALIVCGKALSGPLEQNDEVATVLRRCSTNPLFAQRLRLSRVIEALGGETSLTGEDGD